MELTREQMIDLYVTMKRIRAFEERTSALFFGGKLPGFIHVYVGEEAVAAGVCAVLRNTDYITSTHRGHGHLIAKGGVLKYMMAELFAKKTGYCKGKGGSMHIADLDLGILGANGIVGGGPPIAVGAALAAQYKETDNVVVCFFGDGASNQGTTHEAMNLAACWKLPVVFVVENNRYGEFTPQHKHMTVENVADRAAGYDILSAVVDGNDPVAVYEAAFEAIFLARSGKGPSLIECKTHRHHGHYEGDPMVYRPDGEVEEAKKNDPIPLFEKRLLDMKVLTAEKISEIDQTISEEVDAAVHFAEESPVPDTDELEEDVYTL